MGQAAPLVRRSAAALTALVALAATSASAQTSLTVSGTLVITGGGTNTTTVRYTQVDVGAGTGTTTIALSAAFPTLVIRGPLPFAAACARDFECWDSNACVGATATSPGACGMSGFEVPATCASTSAVNAALDGCAGLMAQERRDPTLFADLFARTDACLAAGGQVADLSASCPVQRYRDNYESAALATLDGAFKQIQTSGGQVVASDLRTHLQRVGAWYGAFRRLYPASGGDPANQKVWLDTSLVLKSFWSSVYAKVGVPQPGAGAPGDALLDNLFQQGLEADRTVLAAALTSPVPMGGAPLVEIMGDALQSASKRLTQVGLYHDLACRFRSAPGSTMLSACANGLTRTEVSELTRLLGAAASPDELASLLANPDPLGATPHWAAWKSVFGALSADQAGVAPPFQAAVLDALPGVATYTPDLIAPPPPQPGAPPPAATRATPPLMALARIVQDARVRAGSYAVTGLFDSTFQGILRAGIQQDRVNGVISTVQNRTTALSAQVATYKATRLQLANTVLQQMTNLATQQGVTDQVTAKITRQVQLRQDLAGLRNSIEVEEARFGDFMRAYNGLAQLVAGNPGTALNHFLWSATVASSDARWPAPPASPSPADALSSLVAPSTLVSGGLAKKWPIIVSRGDILNVTTSNTWSPSCALRTARFVNPRNNAPAQFTVPAPALTGPEGYLATFSNNTFNVSSNQSVHSTDHYVVDSDGNKQCGGVSASLPIPINVILPIPISLFGSGSADWCHTHDEGTRTSDTTSTSVSSGDESRMSAAFATGIRTPNTPFPTFPAGSLLLVQVARGGTTRGAILDVQVLQKPFSSAVMSADADVYLVVNDIADPACGPADPGSLTLSIDQLRGFGTIAAQLGAGMAQALRDLRLAQNLVLEQGRVGPQQMASLRDQAFVDLVSACGASCSSPSYYPPEILKFFDAWVGKQLATLERKVDARTVERELTLLDLELAALAHDLGNLGDQARLLRLVPTWLLKDLDTELLQSNTRSLLDLLVADLFPIIDLRQPATLQDLDPNQLNRLLGTPVLGTIQLDWTGSLADWTTATVNASTNITDRLHDRLINIPVLNDHILAVGFPKPGTVGLPQGNWQRASPERAKALWDAIGAGTPFVSIYVDPTDLYSMAAGSTDVLFCNDSVPVMTAMVIFMVRPGFPFASQPFPGLATPVSVNRNLQFPDVGALKSYRIDNTDWLNQGVRVTAGEAVDLDAAVSAITSGTAVPLYRVGDGLSPLTQFDVALPNLTVSPSGVGTAPADGATELVLAFRAESRNVANIGLPPMCQ